jgi:hypothetical protein
MSKRILVVEGQKDNRQIIRAPKQPAKRRGASSMLAP